MFGKMSVDQRLSIKQLGICFNINIFGLKGFDTGRLVI